MGARGVIPDVLMPPEVHGQPKDLPLEFQGALYRKLIWIGY